MNLVALGKFLFVVALLAAACGAIPSDTLRGGGGDGQEYVAMLADARARFDATPRNEESVRSAAAAFARALAIRADEYDALCDAARACAWLGEYMPGREQRRPIIREGILYANTALALQPRGVEARFYHGVLAGLLGDVDHDYGLDAARTVESDMKALIAQEADIARAGPWRVLGTLYVRAPGPPTSVGSLRNARKMLTAAIEKAPAWPENHLYMAELETGGDQLGNEHSARQRLEKHLLGPDARAPAGYEFEFAAWQEKARDLLAKRK